MTRLILLRHAKAAADDPGGDRARPLAERGRQASQAVAAWLKTNGPAPELVLCSPALRTRQTLALILPAWPQAPKVAYEDGLYLAGARQLLARLHEVPAGTATVLLVGHNPGLQDLAVLLAGGKTGARLKKQIAATFPTAALAVFAGPASWAALDRQAARLLAFVTPRELAA